MCGSLCHLDVYLPRKLTNLSWCVIAAAGSFLQSTDPTKYPHYNKATTPNDLIKHPWSVSGSENGMLFCHLTWTNWACISLSEAFYKQKLKCLQDRPIKVSTEKIYSWRCLWTSDVNDLCSDWRSCNVWVELLWAQKADMQMWCVLSSFHTGTIINLNNNYIVHQRFEMKPHVKQLWYPWQI